MMWHQSLKVKLSLYIVIGLLVILAVSSAVIVSTVTSREEQLAFEQSIEFTHGYASDFNAQMVDDMTIASTLANSMSAYGSANPDEIRNILESIMVSNPDIYGDYIMYEPDAFDGDDEAYIGKGGHDSNGRLSYYFYREEGLPVFEVEPYDYEEELEQDYYFLPRDSLDNSVIEPYLEEGVLMISYTSPIIKEGKFAGIAGVDVSLDYIDESVSHIRVFDTGYAIVTSNSGVLLSHPEKKDWIGTKSLTDFGVEEISDMASDIGQGKAGYIETIDPSTGKEVVMFYSPIETGDFSVVLSVPRAEMLVGVKELQDRLMIIFGSAMIFMAGVTFLIARRIIKPVDELVDAANKMADNDFGVEVKHSSKDEMGQLADSIRTMSVNLGQNLRQLVEDIQQSTVRVASTAEEMSASTEEMTAASNQVADTVAEVSRGSQVQSERSEEVSRAMADMNNSIQEVARNAQDAAETATGASNLIQEVGKQSENLLVKMEAIQNTSSDTAQVIQELDGKSKEIGEIVNLITNIADQTNLLALNAAIEAARAGDHGRGFAVVADEVRKLAEESGSAAQEIATLIHEIQISTGNAVTSMKRGTTEVEGGAQSLNETVEAVKNIVAGGGKVARMAENIAAAAQEQAASIEEVTASVEEVSAISQQSAAGSQEASAAVEEQSASMQELSRSSQELAAMAEKLQAATGNFNLR